MADHDGPGGCAAQLRAGMHPDDITISTEPPLICGPYTTAGSRQRGVIPCPSEAAYKRHIRHREVPCEEDFAAVAAATRRRRAAREDAVPGNEGSRT